MKVLNAYPLITTQHLLETRDFHVEHFGMVVVFEASWVVILSNGPGGPLCLGLMSPDHPSRPPDPETFNGEGIILTIQVADAGDSCARLKSRGAPIVYDLHDEPWGQRRFMTRDPSGRLIDVVEQTAPAPGYWDRYMQG
jgi:catechol 2,3-dioxygenase-like lactoylglutathione lyase family enzyme